jgi:hypothetical protein
VSSYQRRQRNRGSKGSGYSQAVRLLGGSPGRQTALPKVYPPAGTTWSSDNTTGEEQFQDITGQYVRTEDGFMGLVLGCNDEYVKIRVTASTDERGRRGTYTEIVRNREEVEVISGKDLFNQSAREMVHRVVNNLQPKKVEPVLNSQDSRTIVRLCYDESTWRYTFVKDGERTGSLSSLQTARDLKELEALHHHEALPRKVMEAARQNRVIRLSVRSDLMEQMLR